MPRTLNPVRKIKSQVGATVNLLAYVQRPNGTSIHLTEPDTAESVTLTQEPSGAVIELRRSGPLAVTAPIGPSSLWVESIDGAAGYNLAYLLDTSAPLEHSTSDEESTAAPLLQGWYRIVIRLSSGAVQEFELSLRD